MVLDFGFEFSVGAVDAKVALRIDGGTWYLRMEDSLSLDKSKKSSTFLDIVLKYYKIRAHLQFKYDPTIPPSLPHVTHF